MNREDLIQLAAETLKCEGQCAAGHYIYHDEPTGWWVVDEIEMSWLGKLVHDDRATAYEKWCATTTATEVDVGLVVRDWEITDTADQQALMHEMIEAGDVVASLVLMFLRDDVKDTIRINAEIERDRCDCGDEHDDECVNHPMHASEDQL